MRNEVVERGIVHAREQLGGHFLPFRAGDLQAPFLFRTGQKLVAEGHPFHMQLLVAPRHVDVYILVVRTAALHGDEVNGEAATVRFQHR